MSEHETPPRPRTARALAGVIRARGQASAHADADAANVAAASAAAPAAPAAKAADEASMDGPAMSEPSLAEIFDTASPASLPLFASQEPPSAATGTGSVPAATAAAPTAAPTAGPTTAPIAGPPAFGPPAFGLTAAGARGPRLVARSDERASQSPRSLMTATTTPVALPSTTVRGTGASTPGTAPSSATQETAHATAHAGARANVQRRNQLADHQLVRVLQRGIGERLAARSAGLARLSPLDEEMLAQQVATEVLNDYVAEHEAQGQTVFTDPAVRQATIHAAVDRVVKHGLLQQYLERDDVENIDAIGFDQVVLSLADGSKEMVGPIASSDEDLVETLAMWASRVGQGEKQLSPANPILEMPLRDGSRLSATIEVSARPTVSIRRHRLSRVDLQQLIDADMCTEAQASLLAACVLARRNVVVSGAPGSGKTTFLRALATTIDPGELYGTIETDYELYLHENTDQLVKPWRSRQGSGELRPDGTRPGEIGVAALMYAALRHNVTRMVVGEVRTPLEVRMLTEAMNAAHGTMATLHARTATAVISRLVNALTSQGYSDAYAREQVGEHVDVIVHIEAVTRPDGAPWRRVSEILEISEGENQVARTVLFGRRSGERGAHLRTTHAEPQTAPSFLDELVAVGFDPAWLDQAAGELTSHVLGDLPGRLPADFAGDFSSRPPRRNRSSSAHRDTGRNTRRDTERDTRREIHEQPRGEW